MRSGAFSWHDTPNDVLKDSFPCEYSTTDVGLALHHTRDMGLKEYCPPMNYERHVLLYVWADILWTAGMDSR